MKDLKEGLTSTRKADTTHVRKSIQVYIARPCEWGSVKYERANFLRPASEYPPGSPEATAADFERLRAYLRAARDHISDALDSMECHQSTDPQLRDVDGMKRAAYAVDTDAKPGCPFGASGLPHVAPAAASLMMAIDQATRYGLLPADPGQPWTAGAEDSLPQKDDPAAERARVAALAAEVKAEFSPRPRFEVVPRDQVNGRLAEYFDQCTAVILARSYNKGDRRVTFSPDNASDWPKLGFAVVDNGPSPEREWYADLAVTREYREDSPSACHHGRTVGTCMSCCDEGDPIYRPAPSAAALNAAAEDGLE